MQYSPITINIELKKKTEKKQEITCVKNLVMHKRK